MKTSFGKNKPGLAVACALALSFASGAVVAQSNQPIDTRQVWVDQSQRQVWMNGFGECWHSAYGPPPTTGPCSPALAQYVAPPPPPAPAPAPVYVAPPPPPAPAPVIAPAPLPPRQTRG